VGEAVLSVRWGWHRRLATDKGVFWVDTPLDLQEVKPFTREINDSWCVVACLPYWEARFREVGLNVAGVIPRPIDVYAAEKARKLEGRWRERYGRYIVTVGGDQIIAPPRLPRKGLDMYDKLAGYVKEKYGLNAVAVSNWVHFKNVTRIPLGSLSEEELLSLIRDAELFVWPSRCEGFGLPPLEAMAVGQVVVCCDNPTNQHLVGVKFDYRDEVKVFMPEISRFYTAFDYSFEALKEAVDYALGLTREEREDLVAEAMEAASYYRPDIIAQLLVEV